VRVCLQQLILARTECVPNTHISHELGRLPVQNPDFVLYANLYSPRNGSTTETKQYKLLYNIAVDPKIVRLKIAPNKWKTCAGIILKCATIQDKKLSYRRGTARCVVSVEICQFQRNSAETTCTTSPDQIDGMKLEI